MDDEDLPTLVTSDEALSLLRIRNAPRRIARWQERGVLDVAGYLYPDAKTAGIPLYSVERLLELVTPRKPLLAIR